MSSGKRVLCKTGKSVGKQGILGDGYNTFILLFKVAL